MAGAAAGHHRTLAVSHPLGPHVDMLAQGHELRRVRRPQDEAGAALDVLYGGSGLGHHHPAPHPVVPTAVVAGTIFITIFVIILVSTVPMLRLSARRGAPAHPHVAVPIVHLGHAAHPPPQLHDVAGGREVETDAPFHVARRHRGARDLHRTRVRHLRNHPGAVSVRRSRRTCSGLASRTTRGAAASQRGDECDGEDAFEDFHVVSVLEGPSAAGESASIVAFQLTSYALFPAGQAGPVHEVSR